MTDKAPFDLDAALAALELEERNARPRVSGSLQMRVLGDAAEVSVARAGAAAPAPQERAACREYNGGTRWFGLFDAWSGATVAAAALCLLIGLGVGYEVGAEVMARAGLDESEIAFAADDDGGFSMFEDVI